jgi:hypothetical protein
MDQAPKALNLVVNGIDTKVMWDANIALDTVFGINGLKVTTGYVGLDFDAACTLNDGTGSPAFDPLTSSRVGTIYSRKDSVFKARMRSMTSGFEFARGNTVFAAEYMDNHYDLSLALPATLHKGAASNKDFHAIGYYASLSQRFTDWLQLGLYYSEYYANKDDKDGNKAVEEGIIVDGQQFAKWLKDTCVTARFDLTPNWLLKLETHYMDGAVLMLSDDGNLTPDGLATTYQRYWMLYTAKLSYSF